MWVYSLTEAQPDSFEAVLEAAQQAAANTPAGDMEHWQLHQDIIKQQFQPLLQRFVTESSTQVRLWAVACRKDNTSRSMPNRDSPTCLWE